MGRLILPHTGQVYVDANVVIYAIERIEPYATLLQPLWQAVAQARLQVITSELTWLETLTKPLRDHNDRLEALIRAFLSAEGVALLPATLATWEQAARLRGLGLRTPDALHAATALIQQCALFLTNDAVFRRISALPVVVLAEVVDTSVEF